MNKWQSVMFVHVLLVFLLFVQVLPFSVFPELPSSSVLIWNSSFWLEPFFSFFDFPSHEHGNFFILMRVIFFPGQFSQKENPRDKDGRPAVTVADDSSPWWTLLKEAVVKAGGELGKVEIFPAATDCRFVRHAGIPGFGFSPMANTPILLHDHNEVTARASCQHYLLNVVLNIVNYCAWQICRIGTWCDFSMICGWLSWILDYIAPASCDHWEKVSNVENGICSMLLLFWLATNCLPLLMCSFWMRESIRKELECMKRSSKPTPVIQSQQIQKPWQSYKSSWLEYYVSGNETRLPRDDISEPSPTTKSCTQVRF